MVHNYCWRTVSTSLWQHLSPHAYIFNHQQPETSCCCRYYILWWHLLYMSFIISSAVHYSCHDRRFYAPTSIWLTTNKDQTMYVRFFSHIKEISWQLNIILQPLYLSTMRLPPITQPLLYSQVWLSIKGCFFHYTRCIWRNTPKCLTPDLRRHHSTSETSSSTITGPSEWSRRRMVLLTLRHRQRR